MMIFLLPPPLSPPPLHGLLGYLIQFSTHLVICVLLSMSDIEERTGDLLHVLMMCVEHSSHMLIAK